MKIRIITPDIIIPIRPASDKLPRRFINDNIQNIPQTILNFKLLVDKNITRQIDKIIEKNPLT